MRASAKRIIRWSLIVFFALVVGGVSGVVAGYVKSAPSLEDIHFDPDLTTFIYDRNGQLITRLYKQNRVWVPIKEIPLNMQHAIVSIEDERFYQHHGIDPKGIMRAVWSDLKPGGPLEGASTITQQVARWAFLSLDRTWSRKLKEVLWAIQIERKYSKAEILDAYLNLINFGNGAHGVEAASELYFDKHVSDLTLSESALLAALPNSPNGYSPYDHPKVAITHRNIVLDKMVEQGYISQAQAEAAKSAPLGVSEREPGQGNAQYFVNYIMQKLISMYSEQTMYTGGLKVYTTLDLKMQAAAHKALQNGLTSNGLPTQIDQNGVPQPEDALISLDTHTGGILAMVGGRGKDQFNRAVQAKRQPGSAIKPFIYTTALLQGYTPASVIVDEPIAYPLSEAGGEGDVWKPTNYDGTYAGPVTLRHALEESINTVAVKLLDQVGVSNVINLAEQMGISTIQSADANLAFALGGLTRGVTPLEMAEAYGVLANQGIRVEPHAIEKIVDANGNVIYQAHPKKSVVLDEQTAYMITDMMRGVVERGTGIRANIGRPAAGKTGTTDDFKNAWFVGFTPDVVTAIWLGNDDQNKPMTYAGYGNVGSSLTASIWGDYMEQALTGTPVNNFIRPPGLISGIRIDTKTGLLAPDDCAVKESETRTEIFIKGTQPTKVSPRCTVVQPSNFFSFFGFSW